MSHKTYKSMNSSAVRLCALILLSTGCTDVARPTAPPSQSPAPAPVASRPGPPPAFPSLSRPGQIYRAPDSLYDVFANTHGSSLASRYVLYDGGEFALQFASVKFPFFEYRGHYASTADAVLTFTFDDNIDWGATGSLSGDSMTVRYNLTSNLTDFLDGVYIRTVP